jgi:peptide/nickel transport system ATP-binding protein
LGDSGGEFLQIRDLSITYSLSGKGSVLALERLCLRVRAGEVLGILGESGCGKSTLAHALLRLLPSNAKCENGEILFCGRDLLRLSEAELSTIRGHEISLISQDPALSLNPVMTVGVQIAEVLRAHLPFSARERRERSKDLLREVGFDAPQAIYCSYPHQLSGGQRQRVVIAQALACRPALIIADEPTSKLDVSLRTEILGLLLKIREQHGTAIVVITHEPNMLSGFAELIAVMYAGKIVESGSCAEVFRRPLHPYTEALVRLANPALQAGSGGTAKRHFSAIDGQPPDPTAVLPGCRFEPRCANRMELCGQRSPRESTPEPARSVSCFKYGE